MFKLSINLTIERIIKVQAILEKVISFLCFFNSKMNTFEISIYVEVGFFCLFWAFFVFSGVTVYKINEYSGKGILKNSISNMIM